MEAAANEELLLVAMLKRAEASDDFHINNTHQKLDTRSDKFRTNNVKDKKYKMEVCD